jgi:hypothetical protein
MCEGPLSKHGHHTPGKSGMRPFHPLPTSNDTPEPACGVRPAFSNARAFRGSCGGDVPIERRRERRRGDKRGMTSLAQPAEVRGVQRETGRIYLICYSEHFATRCTVKGGRARRGRAIGCVIDHEVLAMPNRGDAQRSALARDGGGDDQCDTVVQHTQQHEVGDELPLARQQPAVFSRNSDRPT